jgi:hypothetical protein
MASEMSSLCRRLEARDLQRVFDERWKDDIDRHSVLDAVFVSIAGAAIGADEQGDVGGAARARECDEEAGHETGNYPGASATHSIGSGIQAPLWQWKQ